MCIKNIRSLVKIGDSGYQLGPWCLRSAASQKILHSNAQYKLSKHMVLHVSPCHDWAKWIHRCVQQHKYNFGIAERSRAAGHVNVANCTLKVQTCPNTITLPSTCFHSVSCTISIAPPCPFKPKQRNNTRPEHVIVTVGRCSWAGTSEGIKAIKPLRKASTFSHGWYIQVLARNHPS